jgi:hypothetical protein
MSASKPQPAPAAVSSLPAVPLLIDIRAAAQMLGTSVFNVRNLCWHPQHRAMLAPVRLGAKYLFSPAKLTAFAEALVSGRVQFPATPTKTKPARKKVSR